jgi:hypothetical protein
MINTRKLWLLGALALLAACDPYKDENKGPLELLSAFATTWSVDDAAVSGVVEATATATATNAYTIADVGAGSTVFFVKTNKLLDGAKIQASAASCAPAPEVNLTVNGAPADATWFTCYYPNTSTSAEGASVVIYQGADIRPLAGYFDSAALSPGFYVIQATITDKQGNAQTVTIESGVAVTVVDADAATATTIELSWDVGAAAVAGATSLDLQRAPNVVNADGDDEPGTWATIAADLPLTSTGYTDTGLTAGTSYWYRLILKGGTQTATSAPLELATTP